MNDKRYSVILAGPNEGTLTRSAYPALAAAGLQVVAVADTPAKLCDVAAVAQADLAIVCADLALTPDEALELLTELGRSVPVVVVLPAVWESQRERFTQLPNLVAGFPASVNWPTLAARLVERLQAETAQTPAQPAAAENTAKPTLAPAAPPVAATPLPARPRAAAAQAVRLGFWGTCGGAGVSTAALAAARALAAEGYRVALFDATGRGDLHLMAGMQPTAQPVVRDNVTIFLETPTEETARGFDAVIVDGGRRQGDFNARWVALSKPLSENQVRRLAGLPPLEKVPAAPVPRPKRPRRPLGKLISVEVTD